MKIVGLIAEYNPFHNGHLYHIKKAKEITGADAVIVVMSGDFKVGSHSGCADENLTALFFQFVNDFLRAERCAVCGGNRKTVTDTEFFQYFNAGADRVFIRSGTH